MMSHLDERPYLIGVAGPSCAGKTELSRRLAQLLSAPILPLDGYYLDWTHLPLTERAGKNFDIPDALDHDLFLTHVTGLSEGREILRYLYDFATHSRTTLTEPVKPGRFVIVEGLFVLYWEDVRRLFGTTVFVDLDDKSCLERRILRDVQERGRTPESVIVQFAETVRPMAERYIRPTHRFADVVVRGDDPIDRSIAAVMTRVDQKTRRCSAGGD